MESPQAVSTAAPYTAYPDLKPGDRIAVEIDGHLEAHVITELSRKSGPLVFDPKLTRWQQVKRFLTPPRWRGPLPGYHRTSDTIEITSVPVDLGADCGLAGPTGTFLDGILSVDPTDGSPSPGPLAGDGEPHQPN